MSSEMHELIEQSALNGVREVLAETLGLAESGRGLTASSGLFGSIPEMDSLAVMEVLVALENRFGIEVDDDDVSMDTFATVGALADLVERKQEGL